MNHQAVTTAPTSSAFQPVPFEWSTQGAPERVYFVKRTSVALGEYPVAEPVLLIDASLAHRYVGLRSLMVVDQPVDTTPSITEARPVFAIDHREAVLYESARPATIVADLRDDGHGTRGH